MQAHYILVFQAQPVPVGSPEFADVMHRLDTFWWFQHVLEDIARQHGVPPLTAFISYSREEMVYQAGEAEIQRIEREGWANDGPVVFKEQWFKIEDGLHTVSTLLDHIQGDPHCLDAAQLGPRHVVLIAQLVGALTGVARDLAQAYPQDTHFRFFVMY